MKNLGATLQLQFSNIRTKWHQGRATEATAKKIILGRADSLFEGVESHGASLGDAMIYLSRRTRKEFEHKEGDAPMGQHY